MTKQELILPIKQYKELLKYLVKHQYAVILVEDKDSKKVN